MHIQVKSTARDVYEPSIFHESDRDCDDFIAWSSLFVCLINYSTYNFGETCMNRHGIFISATYHVHGHGLFILATYHQGK